jgi:hypothetical protein
MSNQNSVNIKLLPEELWIYSNPNILMMNFKGGKRAEAGQWSLEIKKMLRGIVESIVALENLMNQSVSNKKLYLENQEIVISGEKKYWLMVYLIDNAILRIYACLDKTAQMCRCYFEHKENGGILEIIKKCGCTEIMGEDNCNFGSLINYLNSNKDQRKLEIIEALNNINKDSGISNLRPYRNAFSHKKHTIDQMVGIDPKVRSKYNTDGTVETQFSFGGRLPSVNWFRVEIVNANNAIVENLATIHKIIFPKDFNIRVSKNSTN